MRDALLIEPHVSFQGLTAILSVCGETWARNVVAWRVRLIPEPRIRVPRPLP
jgi:hypothetical protein